MLLLFRERLVDSIFSVSRKKKTSLLSFNAVACITTLWVADSVIVNFFITEVNH